MEEPHNVAEYSLFDITELQDISQGRQMMINYDDEDIMSDNEDRLMIDEDATHGKSEDDDDDISVSDAEWNTSSDTNQQDIMLVDHTIHIITVETMDTVSTPPPSPSPSSLQLNLSTLSQEEDDTCSESSVKQDVTWDDVKMLLNRLKDLKDGDKRETHDTSDNFNSDSNDEYEITPENAALLVEELSREFFKKQDSGKTRVQEKIDNASISKGAISSYTQMLKQQLENFRP